MTNIETIAVEELAVNQNGDEVYILPVRLRQNYTRKRSNEIKSCKPQAIIHNHDAGYG